MKEISSDTAFRQLTQMFVALTFFHTSEYILAVAIHGASRVTLSSLLISKHYVVAMLISVLEYLTEIVYFPGLKQHWWISNFGLIMILFGEIIRKTAIITAGRSFTHLIKIRKEEHHKLVTEGVYQTMRHPSYCGFLVWSVGTQVMLCNPISAIAFAVVVWRFFAERIPYEEHYLKQFFGRQYVEYAQRVPSGGIVALGKFDALHIGHRELTIQASRFGAPYLLSFVGMAEILGWEPRAPIVAKCDRKRVLTSWAPYCGDKAPVEYEIEFASVRQLIPRQFVEKLSKELRVDGVVAGENYRFGYKASGDAFELVRLCEEFGITAHIINSVMDKNLGSGKRDSGDSKDRGQVSSTRVRQALASGDMEYVSNLLGRVHRLILRVRTQDMQSERSITVPKSSILNLSPGNGIYESCLLLVGDDVSIPCTVVIDTSHIHVETVEIRRCNLDWSQEFQLLSVEFG